MHLSIDDEIRYKKIYAETLTLFNEVGLDQKTFEAESVKSFHQLVMEVFHGEAVLVKSERTGWIKRIAWSSKLIICTLIEYLVELYRIYPGRATPVIKKSRFVNLWLEEPNWTLSETAKKTEDPLDVILRGLLEELGIVLFDIRELTCLNPGKPWTDVHDSSVYHRIITENHTTWFEWKTEKRPKLLLPDTIMRPDEEVELHLKWQSYNPTPAGNG